MGVRRRDVELAGRPGIGRADGALVTLELRGGMHGSDLGLHVRDLFVPPGIAGTGRKPKGGRGWDEGARDRERDHSPAPDLLAAADGALKPDVGEPRRNQRRDTDGHQHPCRSRPDDRSEHDERPVPQVPGVGEVTDLDHRLPRQGPWHRGGRAEPRHDDGRGAEDGDQDRHTRIGHPARDRECADHDSAGAGDAEHRGDGRPDVLEPGSRQGQASTDRELPHARDRRVERPPRRDGQRPEGHEEAQEERHRADHEQHGRRAPLRCAERSPTDDHLFFSPPPAPADRAAVHEPADDPAAQEQGREDQVDLLLHRQCPRVQERVRRRRR